MTQQPMSTNVVRSKATSVARVDMNVEVVVIPVSDIDRAKEFYGRLGWRMEVTPLGSGCSVMFGTNLTSAAPGSVQGAPDRFRHRGRWHKLVAAGIEVSEIFAHLQRGKS